MDQGITKDPIESLIPFISNKVVGIPDCTALREPAMACELGCNTRPNGISDRAGAITSIMSARAAYSEQAEFQQKRE